MRTAGCAALAAAAGWLLCTPARAEDATVTVVDELGTMQADEIIAVYSGGRLLGTLHVDPEHSFDSFTASLPVGMLDYTLCGRLQRREADGSVTVHRIDNAGRVAVRKGDTLRAFTLSDVLFALEAPGVAIDARPGPACDPTVS